MLFNLEKFKNGHPAATKSGEIVTFVAIIPSLPASLVVDNNGFLENYYADGRYGWLPGVDENDDLELLDYPLTAEQHKCIYGN